jgi:hypothetical protein
MFHTPLTQPPMELSDGSDRALQAAIGCHPFATIDLDGGGDRIRASRSTEDAAAGSVRKLTYPGTNAVPRLSPDRVDA